MSQSPPQHVPKVGSDSGTQLNKAVCQTPQSASKIECGIVVKAFDPGNQSSDKLITTTISGFLVVLGWIIVNKLQANRERRKQARERVSELKKELSELEQAAINYHTCKRDKAAEISIISKLTRFEQACSSLSQYCKPLPD